ncbi:hypothetical protein HanRHA438_Chr11g0531571 [Helianthus annuus]|nr:hypothetical protein HanIR_Chr11g0560021 [Helianthus annuus]KAJ0873142.1 hypothetical protein HanRHA438_Chr11g0531571 [Helianthus annuus]
MKDIDDTLEAGKSASKTVVDDEEKGLSGSGDEVDAEVDKWIKENYDPRDKEKQKKRKRSADDDDETYVPPPENVQGVQTSSSGGRKKSTSRKSVQTPAARRLKFKIKVNQPPEPQSKPPSPPPEPNQPPSPPPNQPKSPPPQQQSSEPLQLPQSPPQHRISSPIHEQPFITSPHILQTPPTTQPPVHTTPGSSGFKYFPHIPESTVLEQLDDFSFVNDDLVKKLQKKVDEVLIEKKKLEDRVKSVESENTSLLKKVEADQADIDILKVRIAELEEEKARRDEQNEYFKLKNKELEANNAKKEHEAYMLKKVLEDLIGKPIEQKFEEIDLAEVRAKREAEIEAGMKDKGKTIPVEDVVQVTERAIVPSKVPESSILEPCPITSVPCDDDEDDEEDEDDNLKDDADEVYSVHSDDDDDGNDVDDQGTSGIKVTEASQEEKIDEYLYDDANEEPENADGKGEHDDSEKVDQGTRFILRLEHDVEKGEILHTYTRAEIVNMMVIEDNDFNFDFEEELNKYDINQQPDY